MFTMHMMIQKDEKPCPKRDGVVAWLVLFAKHAGDKMPDGDITVLPYRRKTALFEESSGSLTEKVITSR